MINQGYGQDEEGRPVSTVAVIGAGIGGMQAALLLAEAGRQVCLIEREPWIGGAMHLLERTFPTDSCGLCFLEPGPAPAYCPTFECAQHPLIHLYPLTVVQSVHGEAGDFHLTLLRAPRYVKEDLCNGCGRCEAICPVEMPSPYEEHLRPQKAIRFAPSRGVPSIPAIARDWCTHCGRCVEVCPTEAIDLEMQPAIIEIAAGAIIASPGFTPFPAAIKGEYGYGIFDNVITSLQFERMVSWSAGTVGQVLRPSDGRPAKKIAFISCVGSRDRAIQRPYCSSVCCMITAKQATLAHELDPQIESTVFFMDLRAQEYEYERYLERRLKSPGIRYERCQISTIKQRQQSRDLLLEYWDEAGHRKEERFDLVVLAVGFGPPQASGASADSHGLAESLGIQCDPYGFAQTRRLAPLESTRPGIIAIGALREPKDIPETVLEASAAAAMAAAMVPPARVGSMEAPPSSVRPSLADEPPRVGIFLCRPPYPIPALYDESALSALKERIRELPEVVSVEEISSLLSDEGRDALIRLADEAKLNRLLIVDAPTWLRWEREARAQSALSVLGLPDAALAIVDMRGWHGAIEESPSERLNRAFEAIRMALAGLCLRPLTERRRVSAPPDEPGRVLVVGGGPAGLSAAMVLADLGYQVELVERQAKLGGYVTEIEQTLEGERPAEWLDQQIEQLRRHPRISVHLHAEIRQLRRQKDLFMMDIATPDSEQTLQAHALILAMGGVPAGTSEYGHGRDPRIITQAELEATFRDSPASLTRCASVVMIQCVGSRDDQRPYCNRICCPQAIRNALRLKELNPALQVVILYREMRTLGLQELAYQAAREAGILFIRYDLSRRPSVECGEGRPLRVQVLDPIVRRLVELNPDLIVLSTGVDSAAKGQTWLAGLGIAPDENGFLKPEHEKMRPLNMSQAGVFVCGAARGPCFIEEAIVQGRGAALQAALYLQRQFRPRLAAAGVAIVNERLCSGCQLCVRTCPSEARVMDEERHVALVMESLCAGCGICAMVCPNGATQQRLFETKPMLALIDAAME